MQDEERASHDALPLKKVLKLSSEARRYVDVLGRYFQKVKLKS